MLLVSPANLLAVALIAMTADVPEHPQPPSCESGDLRVQLDADADRNTRALCISPELSTNIFFDANVARVELEGRERFRRVLEAADALTLVASEAMREVPPLRVTVYFRDGSAPTSASFLLVVHPALAARQVEVIRHTRPVAFYQREAWDTLVRLQRCEEEKDRTLTERERPGGLLGLRLADHMDETIGVQTQDITAFIKRKPGNVLNVRQSWTYLSKRRVAVEMELTNPGTKPWTPEGAVLRGARGEQLTPLPLWRPEPILPGQTVKVMVEVEVEATKTQVAGAYTLTLWGTDRRSVVLENVTFP
ncbi:DUF2381 family protein [Archangium lipolyticum]|uniref:DUF2381 family protein n=1 Tax=Archangium lipolyticum TaxID=2970465 RepID=UPI002149EB85|nr:DUF2381 family protein [Archangium lipolyticum]